MSRNKLLILGIFLLSLMVSCTNPEEKKEGLAPVKVAGAMSNVMWKGELGPSISLDSLSNEGWYGLGPEEYLKGEVLLLNGKGYRSRVDSDSTMLVELSKNIKAPFFVYARVKEWRELSLKKSVKNIADLEKYLDLATKDIKRPFVFRLEGTVNAAKIHVQNLAEGTKVSSPEDAHQGQQNYYLADEKVLILGFFSTQDQGVFTHHDSYVHLHLMTEDESKMGHLDKVEFNEMRLFLPLN